MTNETLVSMIQSSGDPQNDLMDQLYQQNRGLIRKIANRYARSGDIDDLMQEGYFGLLEAVRRYDPDKGSSFANYAYFWISKMIRKYIEDQSGMSSADYQALQRYRRTISQCEELYGIRPSEAVICDTLNITPDKADMLRNLDNKATLKSLDEPVSTQDGYDPVSYGETLTCDDHSEDDLLDQVQNEELADVLWPMVDKLPEHEAGVLRDRYQQGKTLKEIADKNGKSISRIADIHRSAIGKLREPHRAKVLMPYWEEKILARAYSGGYQSYQRTWTSTPEALAIKLIDYANGYTDDDV